MGNQKTLDYNNILNYFVYEQLNQEARFMSEIRLAFEKYFSKKNPKDAKELLKRKTNSEYRNIDVRAAYKMFEAGYLAKEVDSNG